MREFLKMSDTQAPRMAPIARLPVFLSLTGKRVVLAGGSAAAAWKAELLSAAGAAVDVCAPTMSEDMIAIAAQPANGSIRLHLRDWEIADLANAVLAVGAFDDDVRAAEFMQAALAHKIPYNVIDKPAFCSFAFGAIVNRSPLVIAISTDGAAPVFAQAIRARIEALLPTGFARWAEAARTWRTIVKRSGLSFVARRRFWQLFASHAIDHPDHEPDGQDFDSLLANAHREAAAVERGSVALVGAGPGDPELLTLRAARALRSADVIVFDQAISSEILDFSRREAKKLLVGGVGDGRSDQQTETSTLVMALAAGGKRVVRLIAGDPGSASAMQREIAAYQAAGIALDSIPGVSGTGERTDAGAEPAHGAHNGPQASGANRP